MHVHEMGIAVVSAGRPVLTKEGKVLPCPRVKCSGYVVYNGNYFCSDYDSGGCTWALSESPRAGTAERYLQKLLGL